MRIAAIFAFVLLGLAPPLFANTLTFMNFSQTIRLQQQQDHVWVAESGQRMAVADRLVVETSAAISRNLLAGYHDNIITVTELFRGQQRIYFAVGLQPGSDLQQVMDVLAAKPDIALVQPDILQLRGKAHAPAAAALPVNYLQQLNLDSLWQHSKGKGVKIAVIDDGFDLTHAKLAHVKVAFSYDTASRQASAPPATARDNHGTRVAGILFAAHEGRGLAGLAPEAELIAIRQPDSWTSNTLLAFHLAALAGADVINCSWNTRLLLQPVANAVAELAQHGRHGKGIAVVFAAGNQGRAIAAQSTEASIDAAIVVAATDAAGHPLQHSNYGPSIDLATYGTAVESTMAQGGYGDLGGTSLAAAIVSGLAALLIGAQPDADLPTLLTRLKAITAQADQTSSRMAGIVDAK